MRIAVIGTGYVGLISGVCLADKGHKVICVDRNLTIVQRLNAGIPTIHETGLPAMLGRVVLENMFSATNSIDAALSDAEIVLVAVGTPSVNGSIDLSAIANVCASIGEFIKNSSRYICVVIKSTVIPSTTDTFIRDQLEKSSGKKLGQFGLGMNPEFLREGKAIEDFNSPDRIVFGYEDLETLTRLELLYQPWDADKLAMSTRSAELVKYANNMLLATQISAINEVANLSEMLGGIDFKDVIKGIHLDKRWNPILGSGDRVKPQILSYLEPGCGFGGSCFPKDVEAFRSQGISLGLEMQLSSAVLKINYDQPFQVATILQKKLGSLKEKEILVLGLAFKPDTDDVRESPALKIITDLINRGVHVTAHDPIAISNFKTCLNNSEAVRFIDNWRQELDRFDTIVVITSWAEYIEIGNYQLESKTIFDARGMYGKGELDCANYLTFGTS
jgi:UDPglucose 6-dehydrogenase